MKIVIIPRPLNGVNNITDTSSKHYDREIRFGDNEKFAVVMASYYNQDDIFSGSFDEIVEIAKAHSDFHLEIIDDEGNLFDKYGNFICKQYANQREDSEKIRQIINTNTEN